MTEETIPEPAETPEPEPEVGTAVEDTTPETPPTPDGTPAEPNLAEDPSAAYADIFKEAANKRE